jgi:uncharacterized protein YcfJ
MQGSEMNKAVAAGQITPQAAAAELAASAKPKGDRKTKLIKSAVKPLAKEQSPPSFAGQYAKRGALGAGLVGAVVGGLSGGPKGAAIGGGIGAAAGGTGGAIMGSKMDQMRADKIDPRATSFLGKRFGKYSSKQSGEDYWATPQGKSFLDRSSYQPTDINKMSKIYMEQMVNPNQITAELVQYALSDPAVLEQLLGVVPSLGTHPDIVAAQQQAMMQQQAMQQQQVAVAGAVPGAAPAAVSPAP